MAKQVQSVTYGADLEQRGSTIFPRYSV